MNKKQLRNQLQIDTAAYLAKGQAIEVLPSGEFSDKELDKKLKDLAKQKEEVKSE